jgi:hypothetical protein
MNNISDFEAHRRDEQYERLHEAELDRQWRDARKCPIHGIPLILGRGYVENGHSVTEYFPDGKCPECLSSERL